MTSRDYELLVQAIFQQLHDQDDVQNVLVEHNVVKRGAKTKHQIDVYWEFTKGGIIYRAVVQAKNWATRVDQGEVLKFSAVLQDLPGQPRGIMVAANGYQDGALELATRYGIGLYILPPEPSRESLTLVNTGWAHFAVKGYRKTKTGLPLGLVVEMEIVTPEFSGLTFHTDPLWARDNGPDALKMQGTQFLPHEMELCATDERVVCTLRDIFQKMAQKTDANGQVSARQFHSFDDATFLRLPDTWPSIKITGVSVDVTIRKDFQERLWKVPNVAIFILKNLTDDIKHDVALPQDLNSDV